MINLHIYRHNKSEYLIENYYLIHLWTYWYVQERSQCLFSLVNSGVHLYMMHVAIEYVFHISMNIAQTSIGRNAIVEMFAFAYLSMIVSCIYNQGVFTCSTSYYPES